MHIKTLTAATLLLSTLPAVSQARDTTLYLAFDQVVTEAISTGAVTNISSFNKRNERKDPKTCECHADALIAGVALKGDLSKVN